MIDFGKVTRLAQDADLRVQTAQVATYGDETDGADVEQEDQAEVLHPVGFIARPVVTDTLEGVVVTRGDEPVVLVLVDKGAPAQAVEEGEARMHGVGSENSTAVIRIRNDGSIEISAKSARDIALMVSGGGDVVLAGGSLSVARQTDAVGPHANMTTWMTQVALAVNGLVPGAVNPGLPVAFATISGGATNVKA